LVSLGNLVYFERKDWILDAIAPLLIPHYGLGT